jgi:ketosteroid isomerase-like protein
METEDQINQAIKKINEAWSNKDFSLLNDLLTESVIFLSPELKGSIQGKSSAIKSYQDFMGKARVLFFKNDLAAINLLKETKVAISLFEIKYQIGDQLNHETGTEILIFEKSGNRWLLCWRILCNLNRIQDETIHS